MTSQESIIKQKEIIEKLLLPEINNDYIICGLPNYSNIGDMLIYQGTIEFLKKTKHKCIGKCFYNDYDTFKVNTETIFIIMGGGYMGDTWRSAWETVVSFVKRFPNNKIIIFPQSVYYADKNLAQQDADIFSNNRNITICVRDTVSYNIVKEFYKNRVLLVPDIAFYLNLNKYINRIYHVSTKILYIKRTDKEFVSNNLNNEEMDIMDWPTMNYDTKSKLQKICEKSFYYYRKIIKKYPFSKPIIKPLEYSIFFNLYRYILIKEGLKLISQYKTIYTTRLHAMILSLLLNKKVVYLDNSYGKISSYCKTWLNNIENLYSYNE